MVWSGNEWQGSLPQGGSSLLTGAAGRRAAPSPCLDGHETHVARGEGDHARAQLARQLALQHRGDQVVVLGHLQGARVRVHVN